MLRSHPHALSVVFAILIPIFFVAGILVSHYSQSFERNLATDAISNRTLMMKVFTIPTGATTTAQISIGELISLADLRSEQRDTILMNSLAALSTACTSTTTQK